MSWACPQCERRYPDSGAGIPRDADADEKDQCFLCEYTYPDSLADIHELQWSDVEGAHLRIRQEKDDNDPMAPASEWSEENIRHEAREGRLVGRSAGTGLYYDSKRGENIPTPIGPKVYLSTPEDTVLEVMTDKTGNELLAFTPPEDVDE